MTVDKTKLVQQFPANAIRQREGAYGKMLSYIETHAVIHRLIESTDNEYDFKLTRLEQAGDLYYAIGELTIPGLGTRTGIGVQKVSERSGEDLIKGAASDALKKAATQFGIGLELYGPDYEAGETAQNNGSQRPVNGHMTNPTSQPANNAPRANSGAQNGNNGGPAITENQIGYIESLAKERNIPLDELDGLARTHHNADRYTGISKADASRMIEWIQAQGKRDENGVEAGVLSEPIGGDDGPEPEPAPAPSSNKDKLVWKSKVNAAFAEPLDDAALESLFDAADSPGKWVMIASGAPSADVLRAVGMAAVDRQRFDKYLDKAIAARLEELGEPIF